MRKLFAVVLLLPACGGVRAADPDYKANVKKAAAAMGEATRKRDAAAIIDGTYEPLVAKGGGREKMIETVRSGLMSFEIIEFTASDPGELQTGGKNKFVVVPTSMTVQLKDTKLKLNSFLLGISADDGATWKFISGQAAANEKDRDELFPEFPKDLKLPPLEKPTVVK
jgi:hypothetical protein